MSTLLFYSKHDPAELWLAELQRALPPEVDVRIYPDFGNYEDIEYVLCWQPKAGLLASFPNLRLIFSLAAGFDHVLQDPDRPEQIPIVRIIDDTLSTMMSEYAVYAVLGFHRFMPHFQLAQKNRTWKKKWPNFTPDTHIGVLGIGAIGSDVALKLKGLNFQVHGWSRSPKQLKGITCHAGEDGLFEMLPQCQQIVVVLPLTSETRGIINAKTLAALPKGAFLTNIGRGGHVIDEDLLAALNSGNIDGAFLDVFHQEPLPTDHPFWEHPKVIMTPHIAGEIVPRSCAQSIAVNIKRYRKGKPIDGIADIERGY